MDRATAENLSQSLEAAVARLSETLVIAKANLSADEFSNFKRFVGLTIGRVSVDLLEPIYTKYPDLAPPGVL